MHVGLRERIVGLAALHGEAVPDAVDGTLVQQRVLSIPVDGLKLEVPAIARGHLGGQINVEAGQVAIVADEAIGRVSVVQAHDERRGIGVSGSAIVGRVIGRVVGTRAAGQKRGPQAQSRSCSGDLRQFLHSVLPKRYARKVSRLPHFTSLLC